MSKCGFGLAAILGLAATSCAPELADDLLVKSASAEEASSAAKAQATARASGSDAGGIEFTDSEEDGNAERTFSFVFPDKAAAIPALKAKMEGERDEALAQQKKEWADAREFCPADSFACAKNTLEFTWQVVADTPGYLSLSKNFYTYTGGAHGMYGRSSMVWDREAEQAFEPADLFTSPFALNEAIGAKACAMLNAERAKRRGEPVPSGSDEWPNQCVAMEETVLFLGSSTGEAFDRIGLYYGPYVAGAYAEGDFEFTVPVTEAVIEAVKPEYRSAFAIK